MIPEKKKMCEKDCSFYKQEQCGSC